MTSEFTIIFVSLGGLILTATVTLGGLILTQVRASRRDIDERFADIRSELRDAARERAEIRERIAQVEVSLTKRIARVEISLRERIAQVEASLGDRISRVEGNVDLLREYFVGKGRKVV